MNVQHLDYVHKKTVSYCVKAGDGTILDEGTITAKRTTLRVGCEAHSAVGRGHWSDAVRRLDLRHAAALCHRAVDGTIRG